jgi:formylglycine-generating enzyme required for sulfatase activity
MYGNVVERCLDWYTTNVFVSVDCVSTNPPGPAYADPNASGGTQYNRVSRGGSAASGAGEIRSAYRMPHWITTTKFSGFRVVALNVKLEE